MGRPIRRLCRSHSVRQAALERRQVELRAEGRRAAGVDEALDQLRGGGPALPEKIGEYFALWPERHPRSKRTNKTNRDRISYVLDVEIEGCPLRDWEFDEIRRRQVLALVDHMLRDEGPLLFPVRLRGAPPDRRPHRPPPRRVPTAQARRFNGIKLAIRFTAHEGELIESSTQKNHDRVVPVPPSLARLIQVQSARIDTDLLFPTPTGKLWRERNFYRDVWVPAQLATGLELGQEPA